MHSITRTAPWAGGSHFVALRDGSCAAPHNLWPGSLLSDDPSPQFPSRRAVYPRASPSIGSVGGCRRGGGVTVSNGPRLVCQISQLRCRPGIRNEMPGPHQTGL